MSMHRNLVGSRILYTARTLCTVEINTSVHCKNTFHFISECTYSVQLVYNVISLTNTCSVVHDSPVCKCCALGPLLHTRCPKLAASALGAPSSKAVHSCAEKLLQPETFCTSMFHGRKLPHIQRKTDLWTTTIAVTQLGRTNGECAVAHQLFQCKEIGFVAHRSGERAGPCIKVWWIMYVTRQWMTTILLHGSL